MAAASEDVVVQSSSDVLVEAHERNQRWRMRRGKEDSEDEKSKDALSIVSKWKKKVKESKREMRRRAKHIVDH